ncbi:MAG: DNA repair protein RecO [Clostridium sp.]|nr:DNA repair protein RecO [Clostridium sp.]MCM1444288.1 DNA repair protein RecO [Candidatus Amulumruptor caecigallinarius]
MEIKKVEGIVLNEKAYGETSKIINLITKEYGIIGVIAKGARTLKSDFRVTTTKLSYGYFNISYKEGKLSTLISVDLINPLKNIMKDIEKISYSTFILEITEQVIKQTNKKIFDIMISSLIKIDEGYNPKIIMNIIELKYLDYLGVMPILDSCSVCGTTTNIVTLSSDKGGYVCSNCKTTEKIISDKSIKLIRLFYYVDISKISKLEVSNTCQNEINEFLDNYYDRYTGLYLKSKNFIKNLEKV